jgi:hypothetical protein
MPNATQISYSAYRDIGGTRPGQGLSADFLADCLVALNEILDQWQLNRDFVFYYSGGNWIVLGAFPDLTTSYALSAGQELALRKNLAVKIYNFSRIYMKLAQPVPIEPLIAEAASALLAISGVGPS